MEYKIKKVNNKKQIKVLKYKEHPEFVGNEIEVAIINNEKRKPIVKNPTPNKPKQTRMTINQLADIVSNLALEMRAGFAAVNQRMDKIETDISDIKKTLKRNNIN
jgi:hypothetical protein